MEELETANRAELCGIMAAKPEYSHSSRGERFYSFPLETRRLSGAADTINVILREEQLLLEPEDAEKICVAGELRSFNNRRGEGAKLVITVFARELGFCSCQDSNLVELTGSLCKQPNLRTTPMGRDICDLMLAVNRRYGRGTVQLGSAGLGGNERPWVMRQERRTPGYTTEWDGLAVVRA